MFETIEIETYKPNVNREGYLVLDRRKSIGEVFQELKEKLRGHGLLDEGVEYFDISQGSNMFDRPFPAFSHIACFAVRGNSEGYYIHVECLKDEKRTLVFLGKIIGGDFRVPESEGSGGHGRGSIWGPLQPGARVWGIDYALLVANVCSKYLND